MLLRQCRVDRDNILTELNEAIGLYDIIEEDFTVDADMEDSTHPRHTNTSSTAVAAAGAAARMVGPANVTTTSHHTSASSNHSTRKKRKVTVGLVKGNLTTLPATFEFPPTLSCSTLVYRWFIGSNDGGILPYRRFTSIDLRHVKNGIDIHQKMSRFMKVVEHFARLEGCWITKASDATPVNVTKMWNSIQYKYIAERYIDENTSRYLSGSWRTVLNKMQKKGAFKRTRADCSNDDEWRNSIYRNDENGENIPSRRQEEQQDVVQQQESIEQILVVVAPEGDIVEPEAPVGQHSPQPGTSSTTATRSTTRQRTRIFSNVDSSAAAPG